MALGYDGKLYILAFDHRGSFQNAENYLHFVQVYKRQTVSLRASSR